MRHEADEIVLGFARALRAAGVPVTQDRAQEFTRAVALVGLDDRRATYWSGRATLCSCPDDLDRYDQVFHAWFNSRDGLPRAVPATEQPRVVAADDLGEDDNADGQEEQDDDPIRAMASRTERLRHRDVAAMSASEKRLLDSLLARINPRLPQRRTSRQHRWHRGTIDARRTLRDSLRRMGEPADLAWRRRGSRPRRVVLLIDVSGSMSAYYPLV